MAAIVRAALILSRVWTPDDIGTFGVSYLTPRILGLDNPLSCLVLPSRLALGMEGVDRLLHERATQPNAAIDLFRQNFETRITKADRLRLPLLRDRRRHSQLVSSVECDCFSHRTHTMFETIESGVHIVKAPAQQTLGRRRGLKKLPESRFHEHALADARPVCCDVKPAIDIFAKPNCDLATRGGFALARRSNIDTISSRIQFGELLHPMSPDAPWSRPRFCGND
jgi:hypothetical protein